MRALGAIKNDSERAACARCGTSKPTHFAVAGDYAELDPEKRPSTSSELDAESYLGRNSLSTVFAVNGEGCATAREPAAGPMSSITAVDGTCAYEASPD